jgi:hypothetical protein
VAQADGRAYQPNQLEMYWQDMHNRIDEARMKRASQSRFSSLGKVFASASTRS